MKRSIRIEKNIHRTEFILLLLTFVSCCGHLILWFDSNKYERLLLILTVICAALPALGAALAGILNQGEFRRLEKRSRSMKSQLRLVADNITKLRGEIATAAPPSEQYSSRALQLAADAAKLMLSDVLDWRVVFLDRPLDHAPV
jgi:hypothetical protein